MVEVDRVIMARETYVARPQDGEQRDRRARRGGHRLRRGRKGARSESAPWCSAFSR